MDMKQEMTVHTEQVEAVITKYLPKEEDIRKRSWRL